MSRPARAGWLTLLGLLAVLPAVAHAPAWLAGRLLGPGDGWALHLAQKTLVWEAWRGGELPAWNPTAFLGTPLLAAYRPGALYPPIVALSWLPAFAAFQVLVVASLGAAGVLTFLYLRRLGAGTVGAWVGGLAFALGPYLTRHLGDTATVAAAPMLPLVLLAAESHLLRASAGRAAGLAAAVALLLLAGSPEAARAGGALLAARLVQGHIMNRDGPRPAATLAALVAGFLLAAPQLLPAVLAAREAGRPLAGLADGPGDALPGATGLVLRYVSHTPAPAFALAALPLVGRIAGIRTQLGALALIAALQWGRGPLGAAGALPLAFDFALAVLAGLSAGAQWRARLTPDGARQRVYLLLAGLASVVALAVSAAALGPLPIGLESPVGVLAIALILYLSLAATPDPVIAGVWLLPLTASFLLQPHGRALWDDAPTREELSVGTPTREAVDTAMGAMRGERILTLTRAWPRQEAQDLAYAGLARFAGRRTAEGYEPMVSLRTRRALGGAGVGGALPGAFFRSDPARLAAFGIRWVQAPASVLTTPGAHPWGLGDPFDVPIETGRPRLFALPIADVTEIRLASRLADAVDVPQDAIVAWVELRLASGRSFRLPLRAGVHTAEWAWDRADVKGRVAHQRAPILESWLARPPGEPGEPSGPDANAARVAVTEGSFLGHTYAGRLELPGRYRVESVLVERGPAGGTLRLSRLGLFDAVSGRTVPVSLPAAWASDVAQLVPIATTPQVRLWAVAGGQGAARVLDSVQVLPNDEVVLATLERGAAAGVDLRRTALVTAADAAGLHLPEGSRPSRAEAAVTRQGRMELRAAGPGLLVVATAWDPGWSAWLDDVAAPIVRVDHALMGIVLPPGLHRVRLSYWPPGLSVGLVGFAVAALGLVGVLVPWRGTRVE